MTGTYASFKGKLKVGDRVRQVGLQWADAATIAELSSFGFVTEYGFFPWETKGTLELLSPPAPVEKEEEWWNDDRYSRTEDGDCGCDGQWRIIYEMPAIIAEAKRRGAQEAWKEARKLLDDCSEFSDGGIYVSYSKWDDAMEEKFNTFKNF